MVTARMERVFGPIVSTLASPMPEGAMMVVGDKEGAGREEIVVADKVTGGSELGCFQLFVEHDAKGNPKLSSKSGAIGADVDPLDPLGAVYGAQWVYQRAKIAFTDELVYRHLIVPPDTFVSAWIALMQFQHSIGTRRGGFRVLMNLGIARGLKHPIAILSYFATKEMPPKIGRQPPELVRLRLQRLLLLPVWAGGVSPLPETIAAIVPRPDGVPRFDASKAKRYILAERNRVATGRRRAANGSPL